MTTLAGWNREFRLWHYFVSYSQLLLRSLRDERGMSPRRIDVLFSHVQHMRIQHEYEQLEIDEVDSPSDPILVRFGIPFPERGKVYLINDGPDYVAAVVCSWHEDDGDERVPVWTSLRAGNGLIGAKSRGRRTHVQAGARNGSLGHASDRAGGTWRPWSLQPRNQGRPKPLPGHWNTAVRDMTIRKEIEDLAAACSPTSRPAGSADAQ